MNLLEYIMELEAHAATAILGLHGALRHASTVGGGIMRIADEKNEVAVTSDPALGRFLLTAQPAVFLFVTGKVREAFQLMREMAQLILTLRELAGLNGAMPEGIGSDRRDALIAAGEECAQIAERVASYPTLNPETWPASGSLYMYELVKRIQTLVRTPLTREQAIAVALKATAGTHPQSTLTTEDWVIDAIIEASK